MRSAILVLAVAVSFGAAASAEEARRAKNVVLFVGDGLGASQMALGLAYGKMVRGEPLHLETLMGEGNTGLSMSLPHRSPVTDSAAAATQMATGVRARNGSVGLTISGHPAETILEWAEARGLATGLVTNMRLSHATPASFAAHVVSRYDPEPVILDQMLVEHDVEVLIGGGARALIPEGRRASEFLTGMHRALDGASNRSDPINRIEQARERGYRVVSHRAALAEEARRASKLLGLFAASHLPYVIDSRTRSIDSVPSLEESTRAALAVLSRSETGFFLMVEGGRIDFAGHDNDAGAMLHEILDFDEAVGAGMDFQRAEPDTLVIVSADHGTGGFSFTYGEPGPPNEPRTLPSGLVYRTEDQYPTGAHLENLYRQTASLLHILDLADGSPERLVETVRDHTGLTVTLEEAREALVRDGDGNAFTKDFREFNLDQDSAAAILLARALARQRFVVWSTGGHTSEPLPTFGSGPGAMRLRGVYENTHLRSVIQRAFAGETGAATVISAR